MEQKKVRWKTVFAIAGSFVAFAIGSGFSTGQEILQYFTSYGLKSILGVAACMAGFLFILIEFITTGRREQFARGGEIYHYYCGKYIGTFFDYFTALFVYMSFIVMVGGASATLSQHFGLPYVTGGIILCVAAGITVIFGLKGIVSVIGKIGPLIIVIVLLVSIPSLFTGDSLNASLENLESMEVMQASGTWYFAAYSYVGFGLLWYAPFLAALGKTTNNNIEAATGQSIGVLLFMGSAMVVAFALLLHITEVGNAQVPMLALAVTLNPALATVISIIIMFAIYSSAVPLLWSATSPFADDTTVKGKIIILSAAAVGGFIGLVIPFDRLVNIIYVLNGYIGGLLILFVVIKMIRRTYLKKKGKEEEEIQKESV